MTHAETQIVPCRSHYDRRLPQFVLTKSRVPLPGNDAPGDESVSAVFLGEWIVAIENALTLFFDCGLPALEFLRVHLGVAT